MDSEPSKAAKKASKKNSKSKSHKKHRSSSKSRSSHKKHSSSSETRADDAVEHSTRSAPGRTISSESLNDQFPSTTRRRINGSRPLPMQERPDASRSPPGRTSSSESLKAEFFPNDKRIRASSSQTRRRESREKSQSKPSSPSKSGKTPRRKVKKLNVAAAKVSLGLATSSDDDDNGRHRPGLKASLSFPLDSSQTTQAVVLPFVHEPISPRKSPRRIQSTASLLHASAPSLQFNSSSSSLFAPDLQSGKETTVVEEAKEELSTRVLEAITLIERNLQARDERKSTPTSHRLMVEDNRPWRQPLSPRQASSSAKYQVSKSPVLKEKDTAQQRTISSQQPKSPKSPTRGIMRMPSLNRSVSLQRSPCLKQSPSLKRSSSKRSASLKRNSSLKRASSSNLNGSSSSNLNLSSSSLNYNSSMSSLRMTYYDEEDLFSDNESVNRIADAIEERLSHEEDDTTTVHGENKKVIPTRQRRLPKPREIAFKSKPKRKMAEPRPLQLQQRVSSRFQDPDRLVTDQPHVILGGYYHGVQKKGSNIPEPLLYTCHTCQELMTCPHSNVLVLRCPFCQMVMMPE